MIVSGRAVDTITCLGMPSGGVPSIIWGKAVGKRQGQKKSWNFTVEF